MRVYLEVGAEGGQHDAMAGELLSSTAQGHITEGVVEPQAVEALEDSVGVPGLHEQVVLAAQRGWRSGGDGCSSGSSSGGAHVLLERVGDVDSGVDGHYFSHVSLYWEAKQDKTRTKNKLVKVV